MNQTNNLRTGILWKQILFFALPIAATNMLQQLFNVADTAVVGRFAGSQALAAVGSTSSVINLLITIYTGLAIGANVLIAQNIGAGKVDNIKKAVHTSMLLAIISGVILTVVGLIFTPPLLRLMGTPDDIIGLAQIYLQIYILGSVFLMLYNFESAILRSNGDTKRPLYCLLVSGAINVVLNLFFVIVCHMGVAGVAIATLISNAIGAIMLLIILQREHSVIRVELSSLRLDYQMLGLILKMGIPAAIQGMMFDIANVIIQTGFNDLGSDVIAASTISLNGEIFVFYLLNSFGQACVTFNGQNFGAGDFKRCIQSTRWCMFLGGFLTISFSILLILFRKPFIGIYTSDTTIINLALDRMCFILLFEIFNAIIEIMSAALRGLGYSVIPALLSAFFICGVRILWIVVVFSRYHTFKVLLAVYPVSWICASTAVIIAYIIIKHSLLKNALSH